MTFWPLAKNWTKAKRFPGVDRRMWISRIATIRHRVYNSHYTAKASGKFSRYSWGKLLIEEIAKPPIEAIPRESD